MARVARALGASMAYDGGATPARDVDRASGRGPALLVRVLLEDLAPYIGAE